jgi:predicted PurR-regulated permease PerM
MIKPVLDNPWVRAVGLLLAFALLCFLVYFFSPVLIPLFLAFLVAYILDPVVDYFERRKISRGKTIGVMAAISVVVLITVPVFIVSSTVSTAHNLVESARDQVDSTGGWVPTSVQSWIDTRLEALPVAEWLEEYEDRAQEEPSPLPTADVESATPTAPEPLATVAPEPGEGAEQTAIEEAVKTGTRQLLRVFIAERAKDFILSNIQQVLSFGQQTGIGIASFLSSIGGGLLNLVLFLGNFALFAFVSGYLLKDFDTLVASTRELVPRDYLSTIDRIMSEINSQLRGFLRGQLTVCLCLGGMYAVGLAIFGVPFWYLIAAFGTVASLIPYLGIVLTVVPALVLVVVQHGIDWHLFGVIGTFVVAQALEGNVLTPKIVGEQVGLHPVWVILAVLVFGNLLGLLGLLLAVPTAAALKVLVVEGVAYYKRSPLFEGGATSGGDG